ncbi:uncharacterized protein (TIGR02246 family) [Planomicrobium koreense]|uniref:Uncharacterized protein (TIGR02246 family) n=1 Tax=Planococcus koreensis TaxID=112331 RepID=A0A7W8FV12_9BACL|nr:nuclear transport factor 2 family protein [Planococcus koreensis]MBB5181165.1 uncharacterized protein (TIGR02246 family) [Planococcus koreensis]
MVVEAKPEFFMKVNEAFSNRDIDFIASIIADDVVWTLHGKKAQGKDAFIDYMKMMDMDSGLGTELTIDTLLTDGAEAVVKGKMTFNTSTGEEKTYLYCDIYQMHDIEEKIQDLTSFIIALDE